MTRTCSTCRVEKNLVLFCKGRGYPGGYRNTCKECHRTEEASRRQLGRDAYNLKQRERYAASEKKALSNKAWNERNKDKVKEYETRRSPKSTEYKKLYGKVYYALHVEGAKAAAAEHRRKNPEYCKQQQKVWRRKNPDKHRVHIIRRRTRKSGAGPVHIEALSPLFLATACAYCETPFEETGSRSRQIEHVLPLARGGTNHKSNLVSACQFCNCSKHDRILYYEWLPPGVSRDRTFSQEEIEAYRIEEVARQRTALSESGQSEVKVFSLPVSTPPDTLPPSERFYQEPERLL